MMYRSRIQGLPELFDLDMTEHAAIFADTDAPWEVPPRIQGYLARLLTTDYPAGLHSHVHPMSFVGPGVYLGPGCVVEPGVYIKGPAWIGEGCMLRQGLYVRENVIAGSGSILGHCCEIKNCLLFKNAEVPHFNYVGDTVFGYKAHIGAGVIVSNVRLDKGNVAVRTGEGKFDTGLAKFGALIGDGCEIGCNSVLNPGTILGAGSMVHPLSRVFGIHPAGSRLKE